MGIDLAACQLFLLFAGVGGLRNVSIGVPAAVTSGATAVLFCNYDLEEDPLYTIKWYKGRQEFFRYVPKELPHTTVFPLPGFAVDVSTSGADRVVLRDVRRSMSGRYFCEVSTDAPDFLTEVVSANLNVVDRLEGEPTVELEKSRYSLGDTLRGNCTSPPSSPAANLTWFINGNKVVQPSKLKTLWSEDKGQSVTITDIEVEINSFLGSSVRLQCVADLFAVYRTTSELVEIALAEDRPRLASVLGTRESSGSRNGENCAETACLLMSLYILLR